MMKAHGINPNGGPSTQPATLDDKPLQLKDKGKNNSGGDGGTKRKRKTASSPLPTKRTKIKQEVLSSADRIVERMAREHGDAPGTFLESDVDYRDHAKVFDEFCDFENDGDNIGSQTMTPFPCMNSGSMATKEEPEV
jgi:hypothetical protein